MSAKIVIVLITAFCLGAVQSLQCYDLAKRTITCNDVTAKSTALVMQPFYNVSAQYKYDSFLCINFNNTFSKYL